MDAFSMEALGPPRRRLRLIGELDLASAPALTEALTSIDGDGQLTLDLSELTFIDSTGLHAILQARTLSERREARPRESLEYRTSHIRDRRARKAPLDRDRE
jgi:ABC-type transporter Mla MlaB component